MAAWPMGGAVLLRYAPTHIGNCTGEERPRSAAAALEAFPLHFWPLCPPPLPPLSPTFRPLLDHPSASHVSHLVAPPPPPPPPPSPTLNLALSRALRSRSAYGSASHGMSLKYSSKAEGSRSEETKTTEKSSLRAWLALKAE